MRLSAAFNFALIVIFTILMRCMQRKFPKYKHCKGPQTHIIFMKTHKCASSSIQNILMRYAYENDLLLVMPGVGNYLGHPEYFAPGYALPVPKARKSYNIFTHHTRFYYESIRKMAVIFVAFRRSNYIERFKSFLKLV